jgi:hypothetical protein
MKASLVGCWCAVALTLAGSALAHHSAAGIDRSRTVTLDGTLKQFSWSNPHSWMEVEVPNDKGGSDLWKIEMTAPSQLLRAGWKSNSVKPGDKVSVVVRPLKSGETGGLFVSITLPDGRVLTERAPFPGQAQPRSLP